MKDAIPMTAIEPGGQPSGSLGSLGATSAENLSAPGEPSQFTEVFASYITATPENMDGEIAGLYLSLPEGDLADGNILPTEGEIQPQAWGMFMQMPLSEYAATMANIDAENVISGDVLLAPQKTTNFASLNRPILLNTATQYAPTTTDMNSVQENNLLMQVMPNKTPYSNIEANTSLLQKTDPGLLADKELLATEFSVSQQHSPLNALNKAVSGSTSQLAMTHAQSAPLNMAQPAWQSNLGSRMQWMIGNNVQHAEIRLDPPELGSLEVSVQVNRDQATVSFVSPHAHVRDAIEAAVPRLREMFELSGLSLADVNVQQESFSEHQQNAMGEETKGNSLASSEEETVLAENSGQQVSTHNGILDAYA